MSSNIIGVDAAILAGLQIDQLKKLRDGSITIGQIRWFNNLTKEERERVSGVRKDTPITPKFKLVTKFSIVVPEYYKHECLDVFIKANRKKFYGVNNDITDAHFSALSSTRLEPGRKLMVKVFKQTSRGTTTSEERLKFLETQKAILAGSQAIPLIWDQREKLPKGFWYCSFDKKENLWKDADGHHWVAYLLCDSDADFFFYLGDFEDGWYDDYFLLCFCDDEPLGA